MGTRPVSPRLCRRIARDVGEPVLRAVGHGGHDFGFVTFDHRHGVWAKRDGTVAWVDQPMHWSSCRWLFGEAEAPEHLCGARTVIPDVGGAVCQHPAGHELWRHDAGSVSWWRVLGAADVTVQSVP